MSNKESELAKMSRALQGKKIVNPGDNKKNYRKGASLAIAEGLIQDPNNLTGVFETIPQGGDETAITQVSAEIITDE